MGYNLLKIELKSGTYYTTDSPELIKCLEYPAHRVPTKTEVTGAINSYISDAIGELVKAMVDNGYVVTVNSYSVDADFEILWERDAQSRITGCPIIHYDLRKTKVFITVNFGTDPSLWESPIANTAIIAIGIMIAFILSGVGVMFFLKDLGKTEDITIIEEYDDEGNLVRKETITHKSTDPFGGIIPIMLGLVAIFMIFMMFQSRKS